MRPMLTMLGLLGFLALAFGLRTWLHRRATGSWGVRGFSGKPGSRAWWGGVLFKLSIALFVAAPALAWLAVELPLWSATPAQDFAAAALCAFGLVGTLWSQSGMGRSWRIGVRAGEQTELVITGPFRWVRNPIFTFLMLAGAGFVLFLPTASALAALVGLVAAVELQVRFVEEPHLLRVHGIDYSAYCRRTGRFLPGMGRWSEPGRG